MQTDDLAKSMHDLTAENSTPSTMSTNDNNKSQGLVNTLRRSLRKNRERFYNKRASTMKSCQSLHTCEQATNLQPKFSMTPTLSSRRQAKEKNKFDEMRKKTLLIDNQDL